MKKFFCTIALAVCTAVVMTGCGKDELIDDGNIGADSSSSETVEPLTEHIRPTLTDGKMWIDDFPSVIDDVPGDFRDTTIVSERVSHEGFDASYIRKYQNGKVGDIYRIYRETEGCVYRYIEMSVGGGDIPMETKKLWGTLFDVTADCGDIFGPEETTLGACVVVSKGTIKLQGKLRRAVKVFCNYPRNKYQYDIWVEGIGSLFGGDPVHETVWPSTAKTYRRLRECYENGEKIYDCSEFTPELFVATESMEIPADWPEVDL